MLKTKAVDISSQLSEIREIKKIDEIKNIKVACRHADICFNKIISNFKFRNECEIDEFIKEYAKENKIKLSFDPIVASAKNSSIPHYKANNSKIKRGFLTLDFGFVYKNYCSDMTRTIFVGVPNQKEISMYSKVLDAQMKAISALRVGVKYSDIDKIARDCLGHDAKYFIHSLGHGLGIEVHEKPAIYSKSKDVAKENNMITIEPGVYIKNKYGIRIEDVVLITKSSPQVMTKSRKDLIEV